MFAGARCELSVRHAWRTHCARRSRGPNRWPGRRRSLP